MVIYWLPKDDAIQIEVCQCCRVCYPLLALAAFKKQQAVSKRSSLWLQGKCSLIPIARIGYVSPHQSCSGSWCWAVPAARCSAGLTAAELFQFRSWLRLDDVSL